MMMSPLEDVIRATRSLLEHEAIDGVVNVSSPLPLPNAEFGVSKPDSPPGGGATAGHGGRYAYLIATTMKSTGLPLVFLEACGTLRPMYWTSPRAHVVFGALPSIERDICIGASATTTWA